jgi:hypothetical protein
MKSKRFNLLEFDELYFHTISLDRKVSDTRSPEARKGNFRFTEELLKNSRIEESDLVFEMIKRQLQNPEEISVSWYSRKRIDEDGCFMYMWDECSFDFMYRWLPHRIQNMQNDGWEFFFFQK